MPVRIPSTLPAVEELKNENIFVIDEQRASTQDIRPLRIAILNLMPLKLMTETDLLRLISNTPLQVELDLVLPDGHEWTNTPKEHLDTFYKSFDEIKSNNYDGFIVTGAPVEMVDFVLDPASGNFRLVKKACHIHYLYLLGCSCRTLSQLWHTQTRAFQQNLRCIPPQSIGKEQPVVPWL